jgi:NTE family protein
MSEGTIADALRSLPRPLALIFPGGGALGAHQVGSARALFEAGVVPDLLVGVSAGSVNASFLAWHPGAAGTHVLEAMWLSVRRRDLLPVHPTRIALALTGRRTSLVDSVYGERFLRRHLGRRSIEDAPIPLAVIATDLETGYPVVLRTGDLASAVVASSSFPGVYPPVHRDGRWLVDGGVVADVPLDITADMGAASAIVVAVPPLAPSAPPRSPINILLRASTWGSEAHGRTTLRRPPPELAVVSVPSAANPTTTFQLGSPTGLIAAGYDTTSAWLAEQRVI